jgi:hypothetical protein
MFAWVHIGCEIHVYKLIGNAKCRHLKNYLKGLEAGVYLSEAQNPILLPLTHCLRVYTIFIHTRKVGKGES